MSFAQGLERGKRLEEIGNLEKTVAEIEELIAKMDKSKFKK